MRSVAIAPIALVALTAAPASAAERLTLAYGNFARTVAIDHLAVLCDTGTFPAAASELRAGLALFDLEVATLCNALTESVAVNILDLDAALHTDIGEDLLFVAGQAIHNPPRVAPIAALRGTLLTAAEDGSVSAIELLQRYPTPDVAIDLAVLLRDDWFSDNLDGVTREFSWEGFR